MGFRVKRNDLPKIIARLPDAIDREVDESGEVLMDALRPILWRDTGKLARVSRAHLPGTNHCEVQVGFYLGQGFYSGFQEFGTVKQGARPIVTPTAHSFEPVYASFMSDAVRKAVNA